MGNEDTYKEVMTAIIKSKIKVFGKLAIKKMETLASVQIDADGNVSSFTGDPKAAISQLLAKFEEIAGKTSTTSAKYAIREVVAKNPGLELPVELRD